MKKIIALIMLVLLSGYYVIAQRPAAPMQRVTVQWGDTIWAIAEKHTPPGEDIRNVVSQIKEDNGIKDGTTLQPGDVLEVRQ